MTFFTSGPMALLAAPVFASTVVALPMLVDQPVSVHTAVGASWRAVASVVRVPVDFRTER